jgi:predicted acetyltransferase
VNNVAIRVINPSIDYQDEYLAFYDDWVMSGEDIVPWVVKKDPIDFKVMIEFLYSQDSEEKMINGDWVPHSTLWLVNEEDKIVGVANIRHRLNEKLLRSGGHIGYGIRPLYRRKGYATILLSHALEHAEKLGLDKVLIVCDKGNIGSERTISKNGGQFESEFVEDNGNIFRRFWVQL